MTRTLGNEISGDRGQQENSCEGWRSRTDSLEAMQEREREGEWWVVRRWEGGREGGGGWLLGWLGVVGNQARGLWGQGS